MDLTQKIILEKKQYLWQIQIGKNSEINHIGTIRTNEPNWKINIKKLSHS